MLSIIHSYRLLLWRFCTLGRFYYRTLFFFFRW